MQEDNKGFENNRSPAQKQGVGQQSSADSVNVSPEESQPQHEQYESETKHYLSGITLHMKKKIHLSYSQRLEKAALQNMPSVKISPIVAVAVIAIVFLMIACSSIFVIKNINVVGNVQLTKEDVCRIAGVSNGENLFQLQTDEMSRNMTKDLRIEQAIVRRRFPDSLEISIVERTPVLMIACEYGYLNVGQGGIILDATRGLKKLEVPILTGITIGDLFVGDKIEDPNVLTVIKFIRMLQPYTISQISEINISDSNDATGYTVSAVQMKMGDLNDRMEEKAEITESFINELKVAKHPIEYIDFRYALPYIKLRQGQ